MARRYEKKSGFYSLILALGKTCRGTVVFLQTLKVRGCLHKILFRENWDIFISVSGQFVTVW